jgi:hypothetical protein
VSVLKLCAASMFQTFVKLLESQATTSFTKAKYIYFGASVIYCDEKNVCSVFYPVDHEAYPSADVKTAVSTW